MQLTAQNSLTPKEGPIFACLVNVFFSADTMSPAQCLKVVKLGKLCQQQYYCLYSILKGFLGKYV